jgi:hypothetical protein
MTASPRVSVVVVSRDRPKLLARLLRALDQQDMPFFEIVVVTNAPARPAQRPVRWVDFDRANVALARNAGIRASAGDILVFCDDDCVPEPRWLSRLTAAFAAPEIGSAGGHVLRRNGVSLQFGGAVIDRTGSEVRREIMEGSFPPAEGEAHVTLGTNCAFRRRAVEEAGGFDPAFAYYLDEADLNWRLARAGWWTAIVPLAVVHHSAAANGSRGANRRPTDLSEIAASKTVFLRKHAPDLLDSAFLDFRALQDTGLAEAFTFGLIGGREMARLQATISAGHSEGLGRAVGTRAELRTDCCWPGSLPAAGPAGASVALCGGPARLAVLRRTARRLVSGGHRVSLFCFWPGIRPLTVSFESGGYWLHRGGSAGRVDRTRRGKIGWSPRIRTADEIARIAPQREFDIIAWSRWPASGVNHTGLAELDGLSARWTKPAGEAPRAETVPGVTSAPKFRR